MIEETITKTAYVSVKTTGHGGQGWEFDPKDVRSVRVRSSGRRKGVSIIIDKFVTKLERVAREGLGWDYVDDTLMCQDEEISIGREMVVFDKMKGGLEGKWISDKKIPLTINVSLKSCKVDGKEKKAECDLKVIVEKTVNPKTKTQ